ncbi:MAG: hypothetical protein R2756_12490 [Bacteroidales bacterium]
MVAATLQNECSMIISSSACLVALLVVVGTQVCHYTSFACKH